MCFKPFLFDTKGLAYYDKFIATSTGDLTFMAAFSRASPFPTMKNFWSLMNYQVNRTTLEIEKTLQIDISYDEFDHSQVVDMVELPDKSLALFMIGTTNKFLHLNYDHVDKTYSDHSLIEMPGVDEEY